MGGRFFGRRRRDSLATRCVATHRWRYRIALRKKYLLVFCDACHSLALPSSPTGRGRARPSRASAHLKISPPNEKRTPFGVLFRWRRRRDLNFPILFLPCENTCNQVYINPCIIGFFVGDSQSDTIL